MKKFIFRFLDELLYAFTGDDIACRTVSVKVHQREPIFKATVTTTGEKFDLEKHPQGTEVKAITYSAMQIHESHRCDSRVIVHTKVSGALCFEVPRPWRDPVPSICCSAPALKPCASAAAAATQLTRSPRAAVARAAARTHRPRGKLPHPPKSRGMASMVS